MQIEESEVEPADELKIDKDCFVEKAWTRHYVWLVKTVCRRFGVAISSIRRCASESKGEHYYIGIKPRIDANQANLLQYLLGDDCKRVDFNRARIESGLNGWSKMFEKPHVRLTTIYRCLRIKHSVISRRHHRCQR